MYNRYEDRYEGNRGYFYTSEAQAMRNFAEEYDLEIRYKNELCDSCNGEGKRALHGMVISRESQEDHEFMEGYLRGDYDTVCEDCKGAKVVKVMDESALTEEQLKLWRRWMKDVNAANAESLAERRMGC